MRLLLPIVLLAVACSAPSTSASVEVTLTFDASVSDSALAQVSSFVVTATGTEHATFPITLGRAAMRVERLVYAPASSDRSLSISVEVLSATGVPLATGAAGPVAVPSTGTVALAITLSTPASSTADLGDMAPSNDAAVPIAPTFVNATIQSNTDGTSIDATVPTGTDSTVLLLAMLGGTNPNDDTLVSFTAPSGWNLLTSTSSSTSPAAGATWFWRFGESPSPTSYTFTRNVTGPTLALVAAYRDVGTASSGQFDSPFTQTNVSAMTADIPSIHSNKDFELLVVNAFAPDDFQETFSNPPGLVARQTAQALSADSLIVSHDDSNETSSTLGQASRTLVLVTALQHAE